MKTTTIEKKLDEVLRGQRRIVKLAERILGFVSCDETAIEIRDRRHVCDCKLAAVEEVCRCLAAEPGANSRALALRVYRAHEKTLGFYTKFASFWRQISRRLSV